MTIHNEPGRERKFVGAILPWIIAITAFVIYVLTLNRWFASSSINFLARSLGQSLTAEVYSPVFYLAATALDVEFVESFFHSMRRPDFNVTGPFSLIAAA
jgi:hypothetical protein